MKLQVWVLLLTALIFFNGCFTEDEDSSTPVVESVPTESNDPTPTAAVMTLESPTTIFQSPISPLATPAPESIPTETPIPLEQLPTIEAPLPEEGVGAVYGRVIDSRGFPIANTAVRLGEVVWIEGQVGQEGLVFSDRYRSPQSQTDEWGNFAITQVPPQEYGIVVVDPFKNDPLFVIDPSGEKLRIIDIKPGSVINLEEIEAALE